MNDLGKRIKRRRKLCGFTQMELAKKIGVTKAAVSRWENSVNAIAPDKLDSLAGALEVNPEWLISGDLFASTQDEIDAVFWAPLYSDVKAAAGNGVENGEIENGEYIPIPKRFVKYQNNLQNIFCVLVKGDSMMPVLQDGSIIAVNSSLTSIKDGRIYLLRQEELLRVKILTQLPNRIVLKSFNQEYPDENYKKQFSNINILGEVVWYSSAPYCS
ncbi:XRE family transcriptional regulator (plasmid) [Photobacterium leiognathi subsp. mandapamensis]|uniref:XRE family transcriptional regulator n=1 Tax=Photobacterium leiognathi TaxID=553611 RepID=UPI003AF3C6FB